MNGKVNVIMVDDFTVINPATSVRVPGITLTEFTKSLYNPSNTEVSGSITVSIAELGNGDYRLSYTPNAKGLWKVNIFHATYFPAGKTNNHQIYTNDIDNVYTDLGTVDDKVDALITSTGHVSTVVDEIEINADLIQTINTNVSALITSTGHVSTVIDTILVDTNETQSKLPTNFIMGSPDAADKLTIIPVMNIPYSIDLADTVPIVLGMSLSTNRGAIPTAAEIDAGYITVQRKAKGAASWTTILAAMNCDKDDGLVYYNEVFDYATGYREGDTIRVYFRDQFVIINTVTYGITGTTGAGSYHQFYIRETGVMEMNAKLPNDYIMGSSIQTSMDDEINALVTSTGHISTTTDSVLSQVNTIPTNPMLNNATGSTFNSIPDMAKESTVLSTYTSTGSALTVGFNAGAKEATLLEVQTSTGHISDVTNALTISISNIPTNPMLDSEDGSSFDSIPDMAKQTTLLSVYTSTGSALTTGFNAGAKEDTLLEVQTSTGHISTTVDILKYGDAIWYSDNGVAGAVVGTNGTVNNPCNSFADVQTLNTTLKLNKAKFKYAYPLTLPTTVFSGWTFEGSHADICWLDPNLSKFQSCVFEKITIAGNLGVESPGGDINWFSAKSCYICALGNVTDLKAEECTFSLTTLVTGINAGETKSAYLLAYNCRSDSEYWGIEAPIFDFDADCLEFHGMFLNYSGDIQFNNFKGGQIYFYGEGEITIDATCSGGTIYVAGNVKVTDNSGGAVTVVYKQIMRSSTGYVYIATDDLIQPKINALITSTGHISDIVDTLPSSISAIPTNPMLNTEDGSSFNSIPDMAKESTVLSAYTSTGTALTAGFNAGAKENTLLEVQTSTGHISAVVDELEIDADIIQIIDTKVDALITSTGHVSDVVDVLEIDTTAIQNNQIIIEDKIDELVTSTGHISAIVDEIEIDADLIQNIHDDLVIVDGKVNNLVTSTGGISDVVDELLFLAGEGGSSTIIFTIQTSSGVAIQDATIQVWNTALTAMVTYGTTDSNGQVTRTLNAGSYKVKIRKGSYGFNDPITLVVSANASVTYTGETYAPEPPIMLNACKLYGYVIDGSEIPMEGILVQFVPASTPSINADTGKAIYPETVECTTDDDGYFEADLLRNTDFVVIINSIGLKNKIRVPDQTIKNVFELVGIYTSGDATPDDEGNW